MRSFRRTAVQLFRRKASIMTRSRTAILLAILLGGLAVAVLLASGVRGPSLGGPVRPASYATAPDPDPAPGGASINGLDFAGLTPAQVSTVVQILNENRCNCSCGMTLGECRSKDPNCGRSLTVGLQVVEDVKDEDVELEDVAVLVDTELEVLLVDVDDVVATAPFSDGTQSSRVPRSVKLSVSNWVLVKTVPNGAPLVLLIL